VALESVARAYTQCVDLEERARSSGSLLAEDLAILRADLHALLMESLRQAHIPFADRSHAARIAFELTHQ